MKKIDPSIISEIRQAYSKGIGPIRSIAAQFNVSNPVIVRYCRDLMIDGLSPYQLRIKKKKSLMVDRAMELWREDPRMSLNELAAQIKIEFLDNRTIRAMATLLGQELTFFDRYNGETCTITVPKYWIESQYRLKKKSRNQGHNIPSDIQSAIETAILNNPGIVYQFVAEAFMVSHSTVSKIAEKLKSSRK